MMLSGWGVFIEGNKLPVRIEETQKEAREFAREAKPFIGNKAKCSVRRVKIEVVK